MNLKKAVSWLKDYFRVVGKALGKIGSDNISVLASGMVYSTLIAIVPCVTFLSAFLSAFGGTENFIIVVGDWLRDTFGEADGTFVLETLTHFSRNAMSLGIFGLIFFVISASLLAVQIDTIINSIFRSRYSCGGVKRYGKIIIFIIVMTVFIAFSLALSEAVRDDVYSRIGITSAGGFLELVLKKGGQYVVMLLIFFFLLFFVPNVKVKFSAAAAGSVFGTIVMSIFYQIFTRLVTTSVKFSVIYGSLAAILLALLYCYVVWYIIILTAEATFIYQFRPGKDIAVGSLITPKREIEEGVRILSVVAKSFEKGDGGISAVKTAARAGVIYFRTITYLRILEENGFVRQLTSSSYILARPSEKIALCDVVSALFSSDGSEEMPFIRSFRTSGLRVLEGQTLSDIIKEQK